MDLFTKILDLPVIIQGALGSFLFWLCYELIKRLIGYASNFISKYNNEWRMEYLLLEQAHSLQAISTLEKDPKFKSIGQEARMLCIHTALNRALKGAIFISFGLVTSNFPGPFSLVAYLISIIYFFRALKAVYIEVKNKHDKKWHYERIDELSEELEKLEIL